MTGLCLAMPMYNMDHNDPLPSSQLPYMGTYISPSPSAYHPSYETSPPLQTEYPLMQIGQSRSSQDWSNQDLTLFSYPERAVAKERRREQNRASQRAYRKRKEDNVKGLYETLKDLRKDTESLRFENVGLRKRTEAMQSQLRKLYQENQELKSRGSAARPCQQCSEADVSCSKLSSVCVRCSDSGLLCTSPLVSSPPSPLDNNTMVEDAGDNNLSQETIFPQEGDSVNWYVQQCQIPTISESAIKHNTVGHSTTYQAYRDLSPYSMDEEEESSRANSHDYSSLLQPHRAQLHHTRSLQNLATASEHMRSRSASLYSHPGP